MGYAVKHSTSNVDNTFRKGNVALGVSSEGYEDTATSGLYSGVAPVAGKHNLVVTSATGDPDFYCVDDSELVLLAQNLGGSVETSLEAKNYLNSRSDTVFTEGFISSNIVTDGLVLNLDAKNQSSFLDNQPTINLVSNPDFSNGTTGWNANQNTTLSIEIINGTRFLKVKSNQTTSTPGFKSGNITVSGNTTYTLTIRAYKNDSRSIFLYATGNGTGGSDIVWSNAAYNGPNPITTELTTISRTFTTPSDMTYLQIGALWSGPLTTSEVYVEYMQLEEKSTATSFISGSRSQNTTWYDLSGNNNSGSLVNGPTFNSNGYFSFDGVDDRFGVTPTPNTNLSKVTYSFLINPLGTGGCFSQYSNDLNRVRIEFTSGSNYINLFSGHGSTGYVSITTPNNTVPLNKWSKIDNLLDFDTGLFQIYVNGILQKSGSASPPTPSPLGELNLGCHKDSDYNPPYYNFFNGSINNFNFYTKISTPSEISQNYYGGPIVTDGLVLAVDAGNLVSYESGSTTTYDMAKGNEGDGYGSYDSNGTLTNGVLFDKTNGGTWDFDGTDDYISFGTQAFQYQYDDAFSLEVWCNPDSLSGFKHLIGITFGSYRLAHSSSTISFRLDSNTIITSSGTLTVGEWTHIIATWDPTTQTARVYRNGVLTTTTTNTNCDWTSQGTDFRIASSPGESYYFNGKIPIGRVYNKTLSASEVLQNYNAQKARFI